MAGTLREIVADAFKYHIAAEKEVVGTQFVGSITFGITATGNVNES